MGRPAVAEVWRRREPSLGLLGHLLQVLDPRLLLDDAAQLAARFGGGLRNAEILAAGMANRAELWFGTPANVGPAIADGAVQLGLHVHLAT